MYHYICKLRINLISQYFPVNTNISRRPGKYEYFPLFYQSWWNDVIGLVLRENYKSKQVTDFIAWPSRCHDTIDKIEQVQKRATKQIPEMKNLNYEERLRKLKLPTLGYRRVRGDMIEMYKIIKGKYDKDVITLIKTAEESEVRHSTRTNTKTIVQLRANTECLQGWIQGAHQACPPPPPKIGKKIDFSHEIPQQI